MDVAALATEIDAAIRALPTHDTATIRRLRHTYSRRLRSAPADAVLAVAVALRDRQRWVAYELLAHHPGGLAQLTVADIERLGQGMASWGAVDAFGRSIAGPAWLKGRLSDAVIDRWATSPDRWWRRAALVATVAFNVRSQGGTGDAPRTLRVCAHLAADRDDLVVKALSWALRELVVWDPEAVRAFLATHETVLAARIKREVRTKLVTGRKQGTARP